jgi:hypothetical protein
MRFLRILVTFGALAVITLAAPRSQAQVEALPTPEWSGRPSDGGSTNALINQADCLDSDAKVTFEVGVMGDVTSKNFEVWAGSDCATLTQRDEENSCMKLHEGTASNDNTVEISVRDLVQKITTGAGKGVGTAESCMADTEKTTRTLYFLVVDSDRMTITPGTWPFEFDLAAPAAPTALTAGPGEQSLVLDFEAPEGEKDAANYYFYCSEIAAETAEDAAGGAGSTAGADGTCTSSVLVAGKARPEDDTYECGSVGSLATDSATTSMSLSNGVRYAVAVTLADGVGNESVLSNVACGTPAEVTGFFEAYRAAGGQAGGGFCSFAPARRAAAPLGLALLIACAALARRRR